MHGRGIRTLLVGGVVLGASALTPVVPAAEAASGVCSGVPRCRVVAHTDVTGDGARDAVGVARRGKNGAERGSVTVRCAPPRARW